MFVYDMVMLEADGADAGAGGDQQGEGQAPEGQAAEGNTGGEERRFTQEEVNKLVGGAKSDGMKRVLKELGIDSVDNAKDALKKLRDLEEAQKSELEKAQGETETERKAREEAEAERESVRAELTAIRQGVPADKAGKVAKLSATYEGETSEERIKAVLDEFPELIGKPDAPANIGGQSGGQQRSEREAMKAEVMQGLGLKPKG